MDEQVTRITDYFKIINKTTVAEDLLEYVIDEVIERTKLYLNRVDVPTNMERILASVVDKVVRKYSASQNTLSTDLAVSSVSDNGQSVSYLNEAINYFGTASDNELFGGFISLMKRYRRITVVAPPQV